MERKTMISGYAYKLSQYLCKKEKIQYDEIGIYAYGFEIFISDMMCVLNIILFGILFSRLLESILFLVIFVALRNFCGGYHANTHFVCNIIFVSSLVMVLLYVEYIRVCNYYLFIGEWIVSFAIIAWLAPVENKNKRISLTKRKMYKINSIGLTLGFMFISIIIHDVFFEGSIVINLTVLIVAISMIVGKIKEGW